MARLLNYWVAHCCLLTAAVALPPPVLPPAALPPSRTARTVSQTAGDGLGYAALTNPPVARLRGVAQQPMTGTWGQSRTNVASVLTSAPPKIAANLYHATRPNFLHMPIADVKTAPEVAEGVPLLFSVAALVAALAGVSLWQNAASRRRSPADLTAVSNEVRPSLFLEMEAVERSLGEELTPSPQRLAVAALTGETDDSSTEAVRQLQSAALAFMVCGGSCMCDSHRAVAADYEPTSRRVVSVGDLHGDYQATCVILKNLGLMGAAGEWTGGDTVLVQTGDITDRGDASGPIYKALFRLQDEAPAAGGEVVILMGNHEVMNMAGDFRYATRADTESLDTAGGREAAFARDGWIGKRLRERARTVAWIGKDRGLKRPILLAHAGVLPNLANDAVAAAEDGSEFASGAEVAAAANDLAGERLKKDAAGLKKDTSQWLGQDGPFWTRRLALGDESSGVCQELGRSLNQFGASRMIVGHTPQSDGRVHHRCDGRLILGDTLISAAYTGTPHPSAVEIRADGTVTAVYPATGERQQLPTPK